MDTDPDDTADSCAVTGDGDQGEDGPQCGTTQALTHLTVCFTGKGTMTSLHRHCCCFRHVPPLADILPEHAALVEIALEDANGRTVVGPTALRPGSPKTARKYPSTSRPSSRPTADEDPQASLSCPGTFVT
jgi:hypothetical protein